MQLFLEINQDLLFVDDTDLEAMTCIFWTKNVVTFSCFAHSNGSNLECECQNPTQSEP
jgi:hypothetical protein